MAVPFRLQSGDGAPMQQSTTTCGSACLTVARMLIDPGFAQWIREGVRRPGAGGELPQGRNETERFAAHEQLVAGRTNSLVGAGGRLQVPWPRALGTPPWGARGELEYGAADFRAHFDVTWFRTARRSRLESTYAAVLGRVQEGRPVLLYIGSAWMPRHVVLLLPPTPGRSVPDVYEPSSGRVVDLPREGFVTRRLRLAGWDVPWAAVWAAPAARGDGEPNE